MLQSIVLFIHLGTALVIIGLVLLQRGKGADAGTGFGAGASGTVFGARGSASFFSRATGVLAMLFFITSLALAYLSTQTRAPESLLDSVVIEDEDAGTDLPAALPAPGDAALPEVPDLPAPLPSEGAND
jgi:preprotein translocase subunit SecG